MKKYLSIILCFCMLFMIAGCSKKTPTNNTEDKIKMTVFTLSTCSMCKAFKQNAVPALENEFGDQLELTILDLDDDGVEQKYDEVTKNLEDYEAKLAEYEKTLPKDSNLSRAVPFIIVEGYFAVIAYQTGEETALISDIKAARDGKTLGNTLSQGRWLYKK